MTREIKDAISLLKSNGYIIIKIGESMTESLNECESKEPSQLTLTEMSDEQFFCHMGIPALIEKLKGDKNG
jgi:hypothetical protein